MANFTEKLQFTSSGPAYPIRANAIAFATCSAAAGTAEKAVSARNFELDTGANIVVYFTNTNTASNPTLNVNGTGAKAIYYRNAAVAAGTLAAGRTYQFTYDGNQYELVGDVNTDHLVEQVLSTANSNLPILLAYDTSTSTVTNSSKKASVFTYNPSTQILATPKLTVSTTTTLNGSTTIDNANVGDLLVNGGANFIQIPTAPTPAAGTNDTSIATTAFVYSAFQANDAMVFKGVVDANHSLPGTHQQGWVYKVGSAGTYAGQTCEVGDTIYCVTDGTTDNNSHWVVIQNNIDTFPWSRLSGVPSTFNPSAHKSTDSATYGIATKTEYSHVKLIDGDVSSKTYEPGEAAAAAHTHGNYLTGHRAIQVNNVEMLSSASNTALSLVAGSGISLTSSSSGVVTVTLDNHSSTGTTYGVAATDTYGHVKLVSGQIANNRSYANGEAAAAAHTHEAALPASHASAATTYGLGTTSLYGHVKLYNGDLKSYSASTAYTDGCVAAHQHFHSQYSLVGHDHGTIPLASGGTGISETSGNDWYTSDILHPHFEMFMDDGFACIYKGPLDGITSITDFLTSSYFKMAARSTVPVYANGILLFTGTIMTDAMDNNALYMYILFPDAVPYYGMIVNGITGTLHYNSNDNSIYLINIQANQPYYVTAGLSSILGSDSIGSSTTPVYYDGSDLVVTDLSSTYMGINQEFTVNVGSGLTGGGKLSSANTVIVLGHSNSVNAKTAAAQSAKTLSWSDTFTIYEEKYDAQGHITGVASYNMTMPSNPNTDSSVLQNAAITTNKQYPILLGYDDRTTVYTGAVNKAAGFTYNPSTQILTAPKLSVSTITLLNGSTTIDDATIGDLIVNGSVQLNSLAHGQTPASTSNDTTLATTAFVKTAIADKAPISHASENTTYGVGTTAVYGHVKIQNGDLKNQVYSAGIAAAAAHTHSQYSETGHNHDGVYLKTHAYRPIQLNSTEILTSASSDALNFSSNTGLSITSASTTGKVTLTFTLGAHTSEESATYGVGTTGVYGHVKIQNGDLKNQVYSAGIAAAAAHTHSQYLTEHQTMYYRPIKMNNTDVLTNTSSTALTLSAGTGITLTSTSAGVVTITNNSTNTDASVLQNAAITTNSNYPIILGYDNRTTVATGAVNKTSTLTYNPSTQILNVPKITATGPVSLGGATTITDLTVSNMAVTGAAQFAAAPTSITPADNSNDTTVATTAFVHNAFRANDAMVLKGTVDANHSLPNEHYVGWTYKVASAGTYAGQICETGDTIYCITSGTTADNTHWVVVQNNIDTLDCTRLNNADRLSEGTSTFTDNTELLTSYASNNGFADTNAKGLIYRRDAVCMYNYIKSKAEGNWNIAVNSATVATSANSVAWANVSGHAAGVKSDLGIESSGSTYLKKDGTWDTPTDTNDAVTQTATTTNATYEVLFSGTADNTTHTEGAGKNSNLTFNPSTGVLTVTGNLYIKNPGGTSDWTNPEKLVLVGASNKEFSFKVNNNGNNVDVGWDWDTGAGSGLGLRGSNYSSPGQFFLYARNSTTGYAGLAGDANGVLKWNNRRVVTATDAIQIGSASQPVYINSAGYATAGNTIPTITLNGSATTAASLYAPTSAGTSGQLLKSSGSGAPTWATITASDVGAATADHSHTLSIASTTETANIVLSASGFYKLTAGDQTYNFQLPADNDTKNTAGATEVAANTTMWIVGATGQTANPQTYTKTGAKIDADGGLLGKTITVDTHVTLTYDSTTQSLKFVFS